MRRCLACLAVVTVLGGVLVLSGCGSTAGSVASTARTDASPSPVAVRGGPPYAVLVDDSSSASTYTVSVVSILGTVVTTVHPIKRPQHDTWLDLPLVSTTERSLYFLDAGSSIVQLPPDGSAPPKVGDLPVAAGQEVTFAVSPDDTRIAVGVLDFNRTPVHVSLYVGPFPALDLTKIFESDSDYVWPVAWHGGLVVLAHAYGPTVAEALKAAPARDNPYWAVSYHVVDPATANRVVLMGSCTASGPLGPAGTACIQGGTLDWHGNVMEWSTRDWGSISAAGSLSPDGSMVAAADPDHPDRLDFWRPGGSIATWVEGPASSEWAGWIDGTHVVVSATSRYPVRIVTLSTGPSPAAFVDATGFYAARLPTDIT